MILSTLSIVNETYSFFLILATKRHKYYIFISYITGNISYINILSEEKPKLFVSCTWKTGHAPLVYYANSSWYAHSKLNPVTP